DGSAVPTLTGAQIASAVPELRGFELTHIDFGQLPGPHMTLERVLQLATHVRDALARGADGVVITHGTDTIEETAYLLDLLHHDPRPVVIVGAMRTSDDLSWDGPVNLFSGCLVAGDRTAQNRGVMVVMNNTINAASEVTKTYTEAIDTFVSPDTGPLGIVDLRRVIFYRHPVSRARLPWVDTIRRVELIEATSGCDGLLIDAACDAGCAGLVIAAMGRGNVPPPMFTAIERAIARGVAVVVVSRCWGGRVAPVYGYDGGGARLMASGAVFAPWLNGPKARIALSLALAAGYDAQRLRVLFDWPMS
ncbi:MAG TPA: asparaginase, partial [Myxococcota bacterium]|nr:asparaginase [Myxococcota bacterium]